MPADDFVVDFPTLWVAADWITRHCVVPDGFDAGKPFELADWQLWCIVNHYRLKPTAHLGQLAPAFHFRRSQIVMPQKAGKAPESAAQICLEAVGPALFAGWAGSHDEWRCRDFGCRCGWVYRYAKGEPMGQPWPTPLIQITATSDDQTDNVYGALRPMIDNGPLHPLIPKTGEEFIRLPNNGRIDTVTANARSRLGQRVTFCLQDETGIWTKRTGMVAVAETQRRGLAGMGGRAVETTNAWDPTEESVARRTALSKTGDIFRWHPLAPAHLKYRHKRDRRKIHEHVYEGSPWVDLDAIEAEAAELLEVDPGQAERFFGNRVVAGEGAAFDISKWDAAAEPRVLIDRRSLVVAGVDGARFDDALAIVATDIETGHQWPVGIWERPEDAAPEYEHPVDEIDAAMVQFFEDFDVWRVYVDPQWIEHVVVTWQGRWGDKRVQPWYTNRNRQAGYMLRRYRTAMQARDLTHSGDTQLGRHIANARRQNLKIHDEEGRLLWTLRKPAPNLKIDGAMAAALSWEARSAALAADALSESRGPAQLIRY